MARLTEASHFKVCHGKSPQPGWLGELSARVFARSQWISDHFPKSVDGFTRGEKWSIEAVFSGSPM
jgi:hypothetical protein